MGVLAAEGAARKFVVLLYDSVFLRGFCHVIRSIAKLPLRRYNDRVAMKNVDPSKVGSCGVNDIP